MYLIVTVMWHEITKILTLFQRDRNWDMRTTKNLILTTPVPVDFKRQKPVFFATIFTTAQLRMRLYTSFILF